MFFYNGAGRTPDGATEEVGILSNTFAVYRKGTEWYLGYVEHFGASVSQREMLILAHNAEQALRRGSAIGVGMRATKAIFPGTLSRNCSQLAAYDDAVKTMFGLFSQTKEMEAATMEKVSNGGSIYLSFRGSAYRISDHAPIGNCWEQKAPMLWVDAADPK